MHFSIISGKYDVISKENYFVYRIFFVKAKIDLVAGSMLLIGSRRTTTSPPSTGRYLKKEDSTGVGHINLWYGETHDDLSLENTILRINLFPTKILLKYKHIICVLGPDL